MSRDCWLRRRRCQAIMRPRELPSRPLGRAGIGAVRRRPARAAPLSLEPARRRPAHHQLRRRQHEREVRDPRPRHRRAGPRAGGQGQRRRPRHDDERRVRAPGPGAAAAAARHLQGRGARRRDGGALPALQRRQPRRGAVDRHAAPRLPAVRPRRSPAPRLGHRAGGERQRPGEARRVQPPVRPEAHLGALAAAGVRAGDDAADARSTRSPDADGIVLASHGLFTWGATSRECYLNTSAIIDDLGTFVLEHQADDARSSAARGTRRARTGTNSPRPSCRSCAGAWPRCVTRSASSTTPPRRWSSSTRATRNRSPRSARAARITSCARASSRCWSTGIRPREPSTRCARPSPAGAERYREDYTAYYQAFATPQSPRLRDPNPSVVLVPGVGMFAFGANSREARYTAEFYRNAIRVMAGATALGGGPHRGRPAVAAEERGEGGRLHGRQQLRRAAGPRGVQHRVLGARRSQAAADAAAEGTQPPRLPDRRRRQRHRPRGGAEGRGPRRAPRRSPTSTKRRRRTRRRRPAASAAPTRRRPARSTSRTARASARMIRFTVQRFGGLDILINTAAVFPSPDLAGRISDEQWHSTFALNVTANYLLADEAAAVLQAQGTPAAIVLTSSANAVVPKKGSEAYDVSKSAVSHLVRELAIRLAPAVRVNGIAPATVVARIDDVPEGPGAVVADEVRHRVDRRREHRRTARQARAFLRGPDAAQAADHARAVRRGDSLAGGRRAADGRPATSSRWTAGCRRRFCGRRA